jgi:glycosyltransferase involved in cell wall biosynthesis
MIYPVDIVIPVWNRPVETRASLACLVEYSPQARILMINHGSERETESILEEFAEALDERAILVSPQRNIGRVAALNRGLELATAPVAIIVQEGIKVSAGWLEPILSIINGRPDAGLVVPVPGVSVKSGSASQYELDHGSFGFMAVRRDLYSVSGGFDEEMDAGIWSLRDYSRRAEKAGYRTFSCNSTCVTQSKLKEFGSHHLREERVRQGELSYCSRWGVMQKYCIVIPGDEADFQAQDIMTHLLTAARQGSEIICISGHRLYKWLQRNLLIRAHQNLSFEKLPVFFARSALSGRVNKIVQMNPGIQVVNVAGSDDGNISGCTFDDFIKNLEDRRSRYFSLTA